METPSLKPPTEFWLSVITGRFPVQKLHTSPGHAKLAITGRSSYRRGEYLFEEIDGIRTGRTIHAQRVEGGQIWHWDAGEWELDYDIPADTLDIHLPWKDQAKYEFYVQD